MWSFPEGQAVVIGGSGGVGRQICRQLVQAGCSVCFTYRGNHERANNLLQELESLKVNDSQVFLADALDSADEHAVQDYFQKLSHNAAVHTVVNAAGSKIPMRFIGEIDAKLWRDVIDADLNGLFNVVQSSLPLLRASRGSIVQISSVGISRFSKRDVLSIAPKAAIESLLNGVAMEEGRYGVRTNAVQLGVIDAGMFHELSAEGGDFSPEWVETAKRNTALKRFGTAEDVANAVMYLASEQGNYVTGQVIKIDGGYSI